MRYNQIRTLDISNGENLGVALFVQGCPIHCEGCFNSETWDFAGGKEWTPEIQTKFIELADRPYIKRISLLGGEPLADENVADIFSLLLALPQHDPQKKIWLYTGYTWEKIFPPGVPAVELSQTEKTRQNILSYVDVLVDGPYFHSK